MAIRLETQDLARRLLTYESMAGMSPEPVESETLRVYEKLRQSLVTFAGVAGFQLLASRALALARSEAPSLKEARVTWDGELQGLGEMKHPIGMDKDPAGEYPAGQAGIILIARLLGLLHIFLGEALTLSVLRVTWPGSALDDAIQRTGETREHTR
jgi:hypothetical protein